MARVLEWFPPYSPEMGDDLAFYTRVTLDHIMNELCRQSDCLKVINQNRSSKDPAINSLEECTIELQRLRELLIIQKGFRPDQNEITCGTENQEIKRLNDLLNKKDQQLEVLIEENDCLCEAAEISKNKLDELDYQVQKLDEDTRYMEQGIVESIGLIQDIGDVSQENEWLKGQISQLKDGEARQLIDNLSKQLKDCREESHLMQEINEALEKTLQEVGIDPKEIENKIKLIQSSKRELLNKDLPAIETSLKLTEPSGSIKESDKDLGKTVLPGSGSRGVDEKQNNEINGPETISSEMYTNGPGKGIGFDSDRGAKNIPLLGSPSGIGGEIRPGTVHDAALEGEKIQAVSTQRPIEEEVRGAGVELGKGMGADSGLSKANDLIEKKKNVATEGNGNVENEKETGAKQQNHSAGQGGVPTYSVAEKQLGSGTVPESVPSPGIIGEISKGKVTRTGEENKPASSSEKRGSKLGPAAPSKESESGQHVKQADQSNRGSKPEWEGLGEGEI